MTHAVETRIERRIFWNYGVNSGWTTGFTSYENLKERIERETMGYVQVTKQESRTVEYSAWEPTD